MESMARLMDKLASQDGKNATHITNVSVYKWSQYQPPTPLYYEKGIVIIGQGSKTIYLGKEKYSYDPGSYLVLSVALPAECEIFAAPQAPLLSLCIDIDLRVLKSAIDKLNNCMDGEWFTPPKNCRGLFISRSTRELKTVVLRLLQALQSPVDSEMLGDGLLFEIYYRVLCSENASTLHALFVKNAILAKVDKSIEHIRHNFTRSISVSELSFISGMSQSAFYRTFKAVTGTSPIQFIKKVRLNRARDLLVNDGLRVGEVASRIGYESTTQFSREFKRYYNRSPRDFLS